MQQSHGLLAIAKLLVWNSIAWERVDWKCRTENVPLNYKQCFKQRNPCYDLCLWKQSTKLWWQVYACSRSTDGPRRRCYEVTWLVLTRSQSTAASQSSTLMRSTSSSLLLTKQSPVYSWLHVESLIVNILDGDNATFSDVYWTPDNKSTVSFSKRDKSVSLSLYITSFRSDCCWSRVSPKAIGKVTTYYINIQGCCSCLSASFLHVLNDKIRVLDRAGKKLGF